MNSTTSAIESLLTRMSHPGSAMTGPAPTDAELEQILGAAQRAADHGRLRPWRFIIVRPAQYQQFFDRLAAAATRVQGDPARYQINRDKYELTQRAPLIVVAAAKIEPDHKIAAIEQVFAAGGAAQLVLNAAHALNYKAFLFSGAGVFDAEFKASLGLAAHDHLMGFICIGKPAGAGKPGPSAAESIREGLARTVSEWQP
jgi:nitroreductase